MGLVLQSNFRSRFQRDHRLSQKESFLLCVSEYKRSKKNIGVKKATMRESEMPKNWECQSKEVVRWKGRKADLIHELPANSAL